MAHTTENAGQAALLIPLLLMSLIGGLIYWQSFSSVNSTRATIRSRMELDRLTYSVANRAESLLRTAYRLPGDLPSECDNGSPSVNSEMARFRDLGSGQPAALSVTWAWDRGSNVFSTGMRDCLLKVAETIPPSTLSRLSIRVARLGDPDVGALNSYVSITVDAESAESAGIKVRQSHVSNAYRLQVASLGRYEIVFTETPDQIPQVILRDSSGMEVSGPVYHAGRVAVLKLNTIFPSTGLVFSEEVEVRAPAISYRDPTSTTAIPFVDVDVMNKTFRKGVTVNIFGPAETEVLPIEDNGPPQGPGLTAWQQTIDYEYGNQPLVDSIGLEVTPNLPLGVMFASKADATTPSVPPKQYDGNKARYDGPPGSPLGPSTARYSIIPDPGTPAKGFPKLDVTCNPPGTVAAPMLVYQRLNDDLGIDFTGTTAAGGPAGKSIFCGMIAAKNLKILAPPGGTYVIYGNVIANVIEISGGGKVLFVNPVDNRVVSTAPLPAGQTLGGLAGEINMLASSTAHNFFVPIFRVTSANNGTFLTNGLLLPYRPHRAMAYGACCSITPSNPNLLVPSVGYACKCGRECTTNDGITTLHPPDPRLPNKFCPLAAVVPVGAKYHSGVLYPAGNFTDRIIYTLTRTQ